MKIRTTGLTGIRHPAGRIVKSSCESCRSKYMLKRWSPVREKFRYRCCKCNKLRKVERKSEN